MLFRSLALLTASSSSLAWAFLVPPSIDSTVEGFDQLAAATGGVIDPVNQLVKVECKGCPFAKDAEGDGEIRWVEDVSNALMINIAVDSEHPDQIKINDIQMYPSTPLFPPQPMYAQQVESGVSLADFKSAKNEDGSSPFKSVRLGFTSIVEKIADAAHPEQTELIRISFEVSSVQDKSVDGLDKVKAIVLKTPEGKLVIARVELEPTASNDGPAGETRRCTGPPLLCKLRALFSGGMRRFGMAIHRCHHKMRMALHRCRHHMRMRLPHLPAVHRRPHGMMHNGKPCPHHRQHQNMPAFPAVPVPRIDPVATGPEDVRILPVAHHDEVRPHYYSDGTYRQKHHFMRTVARVALQISVPILIGVVFGMTASLLGMMVGQVVVFIWRRLYRAQNGGRYSSVGQEEDGSSDDESESISEEKPFLDEESLPAYNASEEVHVDEKE